MKLAGKMALMNISPVAEMEKTKALVENYRHSIDTLDLQLAEQIWLPLTKPPSSILADMNGVGR